MTERHAGIAGIAAFLMFWIALFVFGALHPSYSQFTKAISELGALGAPHAPAWNLIGFIVPGFLLAVCGAGLAFAIEQRRGVLWWLLVLSGLGFAGTGAIPAEMRDGSPLMQSPFTLGHVLMSFLSGVPWLIATFLLVSRVSRNPDWNRTKGIGAVLAVVCLAGFALNIFARAIPFFAQYPALAQRISFAVYFGWFLIMSFHLLVIVPRVPESQSRGRSA